MFFSYFFLQIKNYIDFIEIFTTLVIFTFFNYEFKRFLLKFESYFEKNFINVQIVETFEILKYN